MIFYDLTFDKINQKDTTYVTKNKVLNLVQTYATLDRVGSKGLSSVMPSSDTVKNIKIEEMLPSENDEKEILQQELSIMISRILTSTSGTLNYIKSTHACFAKIRSIFLEWEMTCFCINCNRHCKNFWMIQVSMYHLELARWTMAAHRIIVGS